MNTVQLTGRLTKDATGGENNASFTLAVDRAYKREGEPTADFLRVVSFGKTADFVKKYLFKGKQVGVVGRIQTGSYNDKDGRKVYTTDIIADRVEFLGSKSEQEHTAEATQERPATYAAVDDDCPF